MTSSKQTGMSPAGPPRVVVTTSWDDDAASGLKVADLLGERGLPGTFYVPTGQLDQGSRFSRRDLRALAANGFEIGAHTVSHRILTDLSAADLEREVGDCKQVLEQALGTAVTTFCYPRGRFNANVVREVERAGYHGARTTRMLCSGTSFLPMEMPTTVQAYPHTRSNYVRNLTRLGGLSAVVKSVPDMVFFESWLHLGRKLFGRVLRDGGIWHLYGHPWEIEKLNLWSPLKQILDYVSRREGVAYLSNAQLLPSKRAGHGAGDGQNASREHSLVH